MPIEIKLGNHPKLESVCVAGHGQPQPFALLLLSAEAQQDRLAGASQRDALNADFAAMLDRVNATLEDHQKIEYAVVVKQPWTTENGLLTPTLKIKREAIENLYLPHAEAWLASGQRVIWER